VQACGTIPWDAYARSANGPCVSSTGRLVFPKYRDENKSLRVSEQEATFAFVKTLCQRPFSYSVEALASKLYSFTGQKPLSAQTVFKYMA